jgi:hypothetical protein
MTSIQNLLAHARMEDRLLLACARTTIDQVAAEQIKALLRADIDWEYLIERADLHCITPLLNRSLSMISPDAIPPHALMLIRQRVREISQSNLHLAGELLRILAVFDQQGIPVIPFKGPTLALQAYGNIALRPFGDLDVLIHAQDLMPARDLMLAQGYRPLPEAAGFKLTMAHTQRCHEYSLISPDGQIRFELQWAVMQEPFAFPTNIHRWWEQATTMSVGGRTLSRLAPEHLLLLLCAHGSKHLWERLFWICDIAELIRADGEIDWPKLIEEARQLGVERILMLGCSLANMLLNTPLPPELLRRAQADTKVIALVEIACAFLLQGGDLPPEVLAKRNAFLVQSLDRLSDRLRVYIRYSDRLFNPLAMYKKYGMQPLKHLLGR